MVNNKVKKKEKEKEKESKMLISEFLIQPKIIKKAKKIK